MARWLAPFRVTVGRHELKPEENMDKVDWSPERKIVGQAVAVLILFITGAVLTLNDIKLDIPLGVEGALALVIGYMIPNRKA